MLRVIENCDTTSVILSLLEIIKQNQNSINSNLLSNLAIKCLLKATINVQTIINNIQLDKILLQMHLLICNSDKIFNNNINENSQSELMIIRFIKNFIIDVVKIKKADIMKDYNKSVANNKYKDKYIYTWIKSTLKMIHCSIPEKKDNDSNNNNNKIIKFKETNTNINKKRVNKSYKKKGINQKKIENISSNNLNKKNMSTTSSIFNFK